MKNLLLILISLMVFCQVLPAQVGIGNLPKSGSILDLTNSNNKYIVLPIANTYPSFLTDEASLIYYNGNMYLKTPGELKVITPWIWTELPINTMSSPVNLPIGIGVVPTVTNFRLQVAYAGEVIAGAAGNASILIGDPAAYHLLFDNNEIMAKTDPNTAGVLSLQEEDGTVEIRRANDADTTTVLNAFGSINAKGKIKENGFDLLPKNTVIMWYGSCDANGYPLMDGSPNENWHICDGTDGTPDLRERFIVGAGGDNPTVTGASYSVSNSGGSNSVTLIEAEIPPHLHPVSITTYNNGSHSHPVGSRGFLTDIAAAGKEYNLGADGSYDDQDINTQGAGSHSHFVNGNTQNTGGGSSHENRPPYYALIFIMKL